MTFTSQITTISLWQVIMYFEVSWIIVLNSRSAIANIFRISILTGHIVIMTSQNVFVDI